MVVARRRLRMGGHDSRGALVAYVFWKIAIATAIGRYQGALLRSQMDVVADALAKKQRAESGDDRKK